MRRWRCFVADGDIVLVSNYREIALSRMLSQFRDKPRFNALITGLATSVQAFEDECFGLLVGTTFDIAANHDLDVWGEWLGETRGDLGDADYRQMLAARILANRCNGSTGELAVIYEILTAPSLRIDYHEAYPLFYQFTAVRQSYVSDSRATRIGRMMRQITPAGVGMLLVEAAEGYYGFVDDDSAGPRENAEPKPLGLDRGHLARYL